MSVGRYSSVPCKTDVNWYSVRLCFAEVQVESENYGCVSNMLSGWWDCQCICYDSPLLYVIYINCISAVENHVGGSMTALWSKWKWHTVFHILLNHFFHIFISDGL